MVSLRRRARVPGALPPPPPATMADAERDLDMRIDAIDEKIKRNAVSMQRALDALQRSRLDYQESAS